MGQNINSGYGMQLARQLEQEVKGFGRLFLVAEQDDVAYDNLSRVFVPDSDGDLRLYTTIQGALDEARHNDIVAVKAKDMVYSTTDPDSWAETLIVAAGCSGLQLIGIPSASRTQGGLPQIKKGSGSTALLTVRSPGVTVRGLGFNGVSATGGGILLDDDNGTSKTAFGFTVEGCHFKNCVGSTATNAATGGAIMWSATGNAWQVLIKGNRFYKNVGDIVLKGTSVSVPQDVVIEDNIFSGPAANVDCHIYTGGSGINGLIIRNNVFPCFPAIGSGTNAKNLHLTGSVGILANNFFGCTGKTFGAAGNNLVPTTVLMAGNFQEDGATQVLRT